ncbi:MAG: hypothetical protein Kow0096_13190 [Thiohalomonadaceae bacterium]
MSVTNDDIVKIVLAKASDVKNKDIDPEATFSSIGVDSLDQMTIFMAIEEQYGVSVPDEDYDSLKTVAKVVAYINSKTN